ncbi:hypothetical protein GR170_24460 [Pseudooceanicola sp. GBMRC 2024]|uniref:GST N-terminal domain-containing protein n=1 Tax=Pseudooceanicola albus TaxID=2692189 RepID=A0A6L7G9V8_9RHOB|nr:hypothetical protein [Pseudooceanicola albus]
MPQRYPSAKIIVILFYTQNSPFARTARIALREWGQLTGTEERLAANREVDNPVLLFSPVGRVPTIVDGGLVITEARAVFAYIKARAQGSREAPPEVDSWAAVAAEGQIVGFLEGIATWVRENRRAPQERSSFLAAVEHDRMTRCLVHLDELAAERRLPNVREFGGAALASALQLMSMHNLCVGWEASHRNLSEWLNPQLMRPSMLSTQPVI